MAGDITVPDKFTCGKTVTFPLTDTWQRVLSAKGHHLFWLDEYEKMTQEEINEFVNATHKLHSRNKK